MGSVTIVYRQNQWCGPIVILHANINFASTQQQLSYIFITVVCRLHQKRTFVFVLRLDISALFHQQPHNLLMAFT